MYILKETDVALMLYSAFDFLSRCAQVFDGIFRCLNRCGQTDKIKILYRRSLCSVKEFFPCFVITCLFCFSTQSWKICMCMFWQVAIIRSDRTWLGRVVCLMLP